MLEKSKKPRYEAPKARLKRVKAEARAEALLHRLRPIEARAFVEFLRTGSF